ncbi:MAG: hypothetical protein BKP49_09700 [Treponema sp. CETP13]|nr:MAG: hypothetical protein BKP49_09700 [Treponema sp. CETP13]
MKVLEYLANSEKKLEHYYTISKNSNYADIAFDLIATFSAQENHTILTKDNVMDYSNSVEHILFKYEPVLNYAKIESYLKLMPILATQMTKPSRYHKNTVIKLVLLTDSFNSQEDFLKSKKIVRKFHYSKAHKFYLYGWTDGYVFIENLQTGMELKSRSMRKVSYAMLEKQIEV